jgi:hypothetical protein
MATPLAACNLYIDDNKRISHGHYLLAFPQADASEVDLPSHKARLGEPQGRDEPQEFLYGQISAAPVLDQRLAKLWISHQLVYRSADQVRGGLRTGA